LAAYLISRGPQKQRRTRVRAKGRLKTEITADTIPCSRKEAVSMDVFPRLAAIIGVLTCLTAASVAHAQQEFPPPQGKGRVVVLASGESGPGHCSP
jgi:hypothetical protein